MKPTLTEKEKYIYDKIVESGTMEDMFELAYHIGRERLAKENLDMVNEFITSKTI